jgi:hypothetical protein
MGGDMSLSHQISYGIICVCCVVLLICYSILFAGKGVSYGVLMIFIFGALVVDHLAFGYLIMEKRDKAHGILSHHT